MNYFICHEWKNTKMNHAGMVHLCREIKENDPGNVKIFVLRDYFFFGKLIPFLNNIIYSLLGVYLLFKVKTSDSLFLMEFLLPPQNQSIISRIIKVIRPSVKIIGIPHLVPDLIMKNYNGSEAILGSCKSVDQIITLGSSLTDFLILNGIAKEKVHTSFHYVDNVFYSIGKRLPYVNSPMEVLIVGNMKRNLDVLHEIISRTPGINYKFCKGLSKEKFNFENFDNVQVFGFLKEEDLKALMESSDISLNVMLDTVGSNVITSSMAMGMAIVVSDVGSIRDYCSEFNAIFCQTPDDFINALNTLSLNKQRVMDMKVASLDLAQRFSIENFYMDIKGLCKIP